MYDHGRAPSSSEPHDPNELSGSPGAAIAGVAGLVVLAGVGVLAWKFRPAARLGADYAPSKSASGPTTPAATRSLNAERQRAMHGAAAPTPSKQAHDDFQAGHQDGYATGLTHSGKGLTLRPGSHSQAYLNGFHKGLAEGQSKAAVGSATSANKTAQHPPGFWKGYALGYHAPHDAFSGPPLAAASVSPAHKFGFELGLAEGYADAGAGLPEKHG